MVFVDSSNEEKVTTIIFNEPIEVTRKKIKILFYYSTGQLITDGEADVIFLELVSKSPYVAQA